MFVEYLCNHNRKSRTKNFKNCISVLAIVDYCSWLGASPSLNLISAGLNLVIT